MIIEVSGETQTKAFGARLGSLLKGNEIIELVGDVGAGKTTLTKGIAEGLAIDEDIQSPSFTISRVYDGRDSLHLSHYDFYRLQDAGIMANELEETLHDLKTVTIIEWAEIIAGVLPDDRLTITLTSTPNDEQARRIKVAAGGSKSRQLMERL